MVTGTNYDFHFFEGLQEGVLENDSQVVHERVDLVGDVHAQRAVGYFVWVPVHPQVNGLSNPPRRDHRTLRVDSFTPRLEDH